MAAYLDILVLLVVVVLIFYRLRSLLGTQPIEEKRIKLSKEKLAEYSNLKTITVRIEEA